ncbi:MAG: YbaN family protein [Anaerolineae bacterium]|jgi:hypothetical protein
MKKIVRFLLIASGTICVALGIFGVFVPVLPTTPFLLLAAFFYARSSERFHQWLLGNHWFGQYIKDYQQGRGIALRDKVITLIALWLALSLTVLTTEPAWWVKLLLLSVGIVVTMHLLRINTLPAESGIKMRTSSRSPDEAEHRPQSS